MSLPLVKRSCMAAKPTGDPCHNVATQRLTFPDGQLAAVCGACALQMRELAASHGAVVRVEPLS